MKARSDIEARNTTLNTDLAKATRLGEDLSRKVASLQSLNDANTQSIQLLEEDQEHNKAMIMAQEMRLRELVSCVRQFFCFVSAISSFFFLFATEKQTKKV